MPAIYADGCQLHVEIEGPERAPVLMFSNSLGTDLHMWDEQAGAFAKNYRVVRYDQRGHGKSGAPPGPYSLDRLGQDVLVILNSLGAQRVHFCGISMGGMTGMWLARKTPDRLDKLVLANTAAKSMTPDAWNTRINLVRTNGIAGVADTVLGVWFSKEFHQRAPKTIARMREMMISHKPQGYVACCAAIRDMDQRWDIAAIKTPTLVIAGRHDPATTLKDSELIVSRIAGAELKVLEAAHISNIEKAAEFNDTVDKFLQKG
jgi:3-oxoadipate enol-lactonase